MPLHIFGYTGERKTERALIGEYEAVVEELIAGLTPGNHAIAVEAASAPEAIRGFGHIKERNLIAARAHQNHLMGLFRDPAKAKAAQAAE